MQKKTEILEHFKTAIGSTIKSLSNSENVEVSFGNKDVKSKKIQSNCLILNKLITKSITIKLER